MSVFAVAVAAALTAVATALGCLPFLFFRSIPGRWLGAANALAAGVMVGASLGLFVEGVGFGVAAAILGVGLGAAFVFGVRRSLPDHSHLRFHGLGGEGAATAILIIVVMTAHSAAEGIGIGVAYGGGEGLGVATTIAIGVHNVPEGLAIALVLVPRGVSVGAASVWAVISSLPQPLLAVPAFILVDSAAAILPVGLGFAAGAMIWMSAAELLPEARRELRPAALTSIGVAACGTMVLVQALLIGL